MAGRAHRPVARLPAALLAVALASAPLGACAGGGPDGADRAADGAADPAGEAADRAPGDAVAGTTAGPEPERYEGRAFYAVPDPLPAGDHGDLIRYQPVQEGAVPGATRYRIMYLSESLAGDPIAVTGTAVVPEGAAPAGGRAIVSLAHGTTGIADECAPSRAGGGRDAALAEAAADAGYLLAATDYEGLGTPGRHPYLVGESEGRGVLDAARAVTRLPGAQAGDRMAVAGYSQGGHGALWAGQLAAGWTPELELVGTFAGAPASELGTILSVAHSLPIAGFLYMIVAGFEAAYPDRADPSLVLTPAGVAALDAVDEGCTGDVIAAVAGRPSAELVRPDPGSVEPWATLARQNDPGRVRTGSPILIVHSAEDEIVPAGFSQAVHARMCDLGQRVERRVYEDGGGHVEAAARAFSDGLAWIADRFAGEPATSTCP